MEKVLIIIIICLIFLLIGLVAAIKLNRYFSRKRLKKDIDEAIKNGDVTKENGETLMLLYDEYSKRH